MTSGNNKKVWTTLNYIGQLLILASTFTGRISISIFVSFLGTLIGIPSSAIGLKICVITAGIKKYKIILKKRKKSLIKYYC